MLTYAGVPLTVPSQELYALVMARIPPIGPDFQEKHWPGKNLTGIAFPGSRNRQRQVMLNTLYWPTGASRWAVFYGVANDAQLNAIRQASGSVAQSLPLLITETGPDGGEVAGFSAPMWMLAPRPLMQNPGSVVSATQAQTPFDDRLWLITLVDDRYFWQQRPLVTITVDDETTWQSIFADIQSSLGATIYVDEIAEEYLTPSSEWQNAYESIPLLLDALCYNVGHRLVRGVNGVVETFTPLSSIQAVYDYVQTLPEVAAGGFLALSADRLNDLQRLVPANVSIAFRSSNVGSYYPVTVSLASLGLPQFTGVTGYPATKWLKDTALAKFAFEVELTTNLNSPFRPGTPEPDVPINAAELTALARQFAKDWYLSQLAAVEMKIAGIASWPAEGLSDAIEWTVLPWEVSTRIYRPAWNDLTEELQHASSEEVVIGPPPGPDGTMVSCTRLTDPPGSLPGGGSMEPVLIGDPSGPRTMVIPPGGPIFPVSFPPNTIIGDIVPSMSNPGKAGQIITIINTGTSAVMWSDAGQRGTIVSVPKIFGRLVNCQIGTPPPPQGNVMVSQPNDSVTFWYDTQTDPNNPQWRVLSSTSEPNSFSGSGGLFKTMFNGQCIDFGSGTGGGSDGGGGGGHVNIFQDFSFYLTVNFYGDTFIKKLTLCKLILPIVDSPDEDIIVLDKTACSVVFRIASDLVAIFGGDDGQLIGVINSSGDKVALYAVEPVGGTVYLAAGGFLLLIKDGDKWYANMDAGGLTDFKTTAYGFDATNCQALTTVEEYINGRIQGGATLTAPDVPLPKPAGSKCCANDFNFQYDFINIRPQYGDPFSAASIQVVGDTPDPGSGIWYARTRDFTKYPPGSPATPTFAPWLDNGQNWTDSEGTQYPFIIIVTCNQNGWSATLWLLQTNEEWVEIQFSSSPQGPNGEASSCNDGQINQWFSSEPVFGYFLAGN